MAFEITGIDHIVLNCTDVEATAAWYRRALGMRVESFGSGQTSLVFGLQKIKLRPVGAADWETAAAETPGSLDVCFETDAPISAVLAEWRAAGIEVHEGPVERSGARGPITSVYALDPDGNLIEVAHY